jgi:hypothetical protein
VAVVVAVLAQLAAMRHLALKAVTAVPELHRLFLVPLLLTAAVAAAFRIMDQARAALVVLAVAATQETLLLQAAQEPQIRAVVAVAEPVVDSAQ